MIAERGPKARVRTRCGRPTRLPQPEPLVALAVLAGATSRIRVQTGGAARLSARHRPARKQAATLDRMTGGRPVLGLGISGYAPRGFRARKSCRNCHPKREIARMS
ncbi:LLM class flavin-dependent oxidoreductase [Streptomyces sp. NPDC005402]|uniref:LLM class flavin-dependent oxidoreductase n=1 Tax=Streptomyces sp. NPDC005402 TaxID=3155338 RepID=UPI0033B0C925